MTLPQSNIQNGTDYTQTYSIWQYNSALNLLPSVNAKASTANFANVTGGASAIPLSVANIKLTGIGNLTLLGSTSEIVLSTDAKLLYVALLNLSSGPVTNNIRIAMQGRAWQAGNYESGLTLVAPGLLGIGNAISPENQKLTLQIPAFISPPASIGTTSILVNDLSFYRSANGISNNSLIPLSTTVPYIPSIKTGNTQFNFSTNAAYNALPTTSVSNVNSTLTGIANTTGVNLSTTDQALTTATGIAVPTNNNQSLTYTYRIGASQLKTNFIQAGTYSVPLIYTWNKLSSAYPNGSLQAQSNGNLAIVVSDLGEIIANQQAVNLSFTTANDYKNGVNLNITNHLKISATSAYNLYVRATSTSFTSGANSIPLNVLRIGPMAGQSGMNTITLSNTAQQLIQNADPVIDRNLNILYSIPANSTNMLLNKPAGAYTANIVFSFVAP